MPDVTPLSEQEPLVPSDQNTVTMTIPVEQLIPGTSFGTALPFAPEPDVTPEPTSYPQADQVKKDELSTENKDVSTKDNKPNSIMGRPCEFCQNKERILKTTYDYLTQGKQEKPRMLYINELAMLIGCDRDRVIDWKNKINADGSLEHEDFHRLVKELESIQELRLQQRLMGRYNPTGAIFLLKTKHKYIETEKQILAGDKSEPVQVEIIEVKPNVEEN